MIGEPVLSPQHTVKVVVDAGTLDDAAMVADGLARLIETIGRNDDFPPGVAATVTTTTGLLIHIERR